MWTRQGLTFRPVERGDLDTLRAHRNESVGGFRDPMHAWEADQETWFRTLGRERQAFVVLDHMYDSDPRTKIKGVRGYDRVGLLRFSDFDWTNRGVGYTGCDVFAHARARGYATRISLAAAEYAFEEWGMHRVWGEALETNAPMLRALRAAGYVDEARFREAVWRGGRWLDFLRLSKLSTDAPAVRTDPAGDDAPGPYYEPGAPTPDGQMPEGL